MMTEILWYGGLEETSCLQCYHHSYSRWFAYIQHVIAGKEGSRQGRQQARKATGKAGNRQGRQQARKAADKEVTDELITYANLTVTHFLPLQWKHSIWQQPCHGANWRMAKEPHSLLKSHLKYFFQRTFIAIQLECSFIFEINLIIDWKILIFNHTIIQ